MLFWARNVYSVEQQNVINQDDKQIENYIIRKIREILPEFDEEFPNAGANILGDANLERKKESFKSKNNRPEAIASVFSNFIIDERNHIGLLDRVIEFNNNRNLSHIVIRTLCDIEQSQVEFEFVGVGWNRFFQRLKRSFYYSKRLLVTSLSSGIADVFLRHNEIQSAVEIDKYIAESDTGSKTRNYGFKFNNRYSVHLMPKSGAQFGAKVEIVDLERQHEKSVYFLKSYFGYPATNNAHTGTILNLTTTQKSDNVHAGNLYSKLNWKEPVIYKVLESLQFGPKVSFLINPVLNDGFFILSKDMNDAANNISFREAKDFFKIRDNIRLNQEDQIRRAFLIRANMLRGMEFINHINGQFINDGLIVNITELELFAGIFRLSDLNNGNFGYTYNPNSNQHNQFDLENNDEINQEMVNNILIFEWNRPEREFKIIDFLAPDASVSDLGTVRNKEVAGNGADFYNIDQNRLIKLFLTGTVINFKKGSFFHKILARVDVDTPGHTNEERRENARRELREKIHYGRRAFRQLQQRIIDAGRTLNLGPQPNIAMLLQLILNKQRDSIDVLLRQNIMTPTGMQPVYKLLNFEFRIDGDQLFQPRRYIEDAITDLDNYFSGVINRYNIFENLFAPEEPDWENLLRLAEQ